MFESSTLEESGLAPSQTSVRTSGCCCPVHTLPTELLREIFISVILHLKKTTDLTSKLPSCSINSTNIHPPLSLSQTCHRWRDIALDMPELWTALSNTVVNLQNKPTQVDRRLFLRLLARAKELPLSVFLSADTRAAHKLAPHMNHVRRLELVHFPDVYKLELLKHSASALEYLLLTFPPILSLFDLAEYMWQGVPVLFSGSAPSLRALALFHPAFLPRQPFPTLTYLHIVGVSNLRLQDVLELLRSTPALESLSIADLRIPVNLRPFAGQPQLTPTIPLARLRRLALVRSPFTHGMALLRHLAMPREATLDLLKLFADRNFGPMATLPPQLPPVSAANALEIVACGGALAFRTRVLAADGSVASVPRVHCTARWGAQAYTWWRGLWQTLPCGQLTELRVAVDANDDGILSSFLDAAITLTTLELRLHPRDRNRGWSVREEGGNASKCLDGEPRALLGVCALLEQELPVVCPCLADLALIDASSSPSAWKVFLSGEDTLPRVAYVPDILCVIAARAAAGRGLRRVALQGLWSRAQRNRVVSAFAMGAAVTNMEFRELEAEASPLFSFEENREEVWGNGHWTYELPKSTLPWAPVNGIHASSAKALHTC